ncbi:MAG: ABC transporter permease [Limnochordia bacterium]|nr:ABC transporter permease [Limnochordia bacterium]
MFNRNVFVNELKLNQRGLIGFGIAMIATVVVFAGFTNLIIDNQELADLLDSYPRSLLEAFNFDVESFSSFEGWMASEPYIFYMLLLAVFGSLQAANSISKELDHKTGEFLFSQPISRRDLFYSKVVSGWAQLTLLFLISVGVALLVGHIVADVQNPLGLFLLFLAGYLVSLGFAGIDYLLTSLFGSSRTATSMGIGIVLGSFLLDAFSKVSDRVNWLGYFSLFHVYDARGILRDVHLPMLPSLLLIGVFVIGVLAGQLIFCRKDILY